MSSSATQNQCQCRKEPGHREAGMVLPVLMVVFVLIGVMVASLVQHMATADEDAIEEQLAHLRAYWVMSGVVDYSLSRASLHYNATSDTGTDATVAGVVSGFANNSSVSVMTYVSTIPQTVFSVTPTAEDIANAVDGYYRLRVALDAQTPTDVTPALRGLSNRVVDLVVDVCTGNTGRGFRSAGLADCQTGTGVTNRGISTIHAYQRRPPP